MASWRDNLWPASFRAANFKVISTNTSIGRRNVIHQYPLRDEPYVEDLGLDTDEFSIEGYIVQHKDNEYDYFAQRDLLIEELKKSGSGTLIHPFLGEITASLLGKVRLSESFNEGGVARFSMTFVRAEETKVPYPAEAINHVDAVDNAVEDSLNLGLDAFGYIYNDFDYPDFVGNSILDSVGELNTMLKSAMASIQGLGPAQLANALSHLSAEFLGIGLNVINNTCSLGNSIVGMFNGLLSLSGMYGDILIQQLFGSCGSMARGINNGPWSGAQLSIPKIGGFIGSTLSVSATITEDFGRTAMRAALAISRYGEATGNDNSSQYGGTLEVISVTTFSKARLTGNQEAVVNMARLAGITTAIRTAIRIDYTSHNSVVEMMDEILEVIDAQLLKLGNDAVNADCVAFNIKIADPDNYEALRSLRPIFVKSMLAIGASLANIVEYKVPPETISSLAVAYDHYEDLDREKEIITRNISLVKHPGFLPGGQILEVLSA